MEVSEGNNLAVSLILGASARKWKSTLDASRHVTVTSSTWADSDASHRFTLLLLSLTWSV